MLQRRTFLFALLLMSVISSAHSAPNADDRPRVKLRAALVLQDLTVRPVPRLAVEIQPQFQSDRVSLRITTDFDGKADIPLQPGTYRFIVSNPVELEGRRYTWDLAVDVQQGQPEMVVELSNDNSTADVAPKSSPITPEGRIFRDSKNGVVTVESESGHGSGFIFDPDGLILTNAHVVEHSRDLAVTFDNTHRYAADVLAVDSLNDIAILRFNPSAFPQAPPLPLALQQDDSIHEGDTVLAIGSPLNQDKILTRGIVSKVENTAILSDININHGNSGGPLLNASGEVIGITTFKDLDPTGGGVSGIVRIELAQPLIATARASAEQRPLPEPISLPSLPSESFPLPALKELIQKNAYDPTDYGDRSSTFDVQVMTPPLKYFVETQQAAEKADMRARKQKKAGAATDSDTDPYANLRTWRVFLGDYRPVVQVYILPRLKALGGTIFGAMLTGDSSVLRYRYKSDFDRAELIVDGRPVTPIRRSRFT